MARKKIKGTGNTPLKFADSLSKTVNKAWEDGSFLAEVTPVTQDLLLYWFNEAFCDMRNINFHEGQKQAILNTIYVHEVLKVSGVKDMYLSSYPELLQKMDVADLDQDKYKHPKYAIKMATGTGKTWVLNALLIWQFLNARYYKNELGNYSRNFLLVAPGLIVYERLLDAFMGKEQVDGTRDFEQSDFKKYEKLFIPQSYADTIFGFIQSAVTRKEEIGKKVTGEGMIAITNWHLLSGVEEEIKELNSPLDDPQEVIKRALPISPGKAQGNALDALDNQYLRGQEIEYLARLDDIVVFNDEAHHIHEVKKGGELFEVEWQKSLNKISEPKKERFIQVDFSATPYSVTGGGRNRVRQYFPHIVVDFDLKNAIWKGLVKTIVLDRRKEFNSMELDFKAIREGRKVIGLSEGQKTMLRAGLKKLRILEQEFIKIGENKHPKLLVMCEDTQVAPFVGEFLTSTEGLSQDDVMEIHSNRKGDITEKEWDAVKQKLFNIDQYASPKVIVSVLMLREGFDVNNICVIVPLRSSESMILLEQTIGRGLRLMWRENEFVGIKAENRKRLLMDKKEPANFLDILSIVEHPTFIEFYEKFIEDGMVVEDTGETTSENVLGDIIKVGLREDYEYHDFFWPVIIREKEETLVPHDLSMDKMEPFEIPLSELKQIVGKGGETFYSEELTVRTRFGEYKVSGDIFNADSYNEFIMKLVNSVSSMLQPIGKRKTRSFPMMQINLAEVAALTDNYIRTRLFGEAFDPLQDENWRVLFASQDKIITHIMKNVSRTIYEMQNSVEITAAEVFKNYFSEVSELRMREKFSLEVSKAIYERLPYPSNKGGLEKAFIEFADTDAEVDSFIKINEYYHDFAHVTYIRDDGLLAHYYPDFMVKINAKLFIVETKADKDVGNPNVQQKRIATVHWLEKVNELPEEDRMNAEWNYVLLGENTFYSMRDKGASLKEVLEYALMTRAKAEGTLEDYF